MPDSPSAPNADANAHSAAGLGLAGAPSPPAPASAQTKAATLSLSELSDSDSDAVDVSRIIRSSDALRSRLPCLLRNQQGDSKSDSDSDSDDLAAVTLVRGTDSSQAQLSSELSIHGSDVCGLQLGWNPPFLARVDVRDTPALPTAQPGDQPSGGNKDFYASLLQAPEHIYPLRKRSEKNLHPYTKLVWTNADDMRAFRRAQRDITAHDSQLRYNQEDSEDDDYIPGSPELVAEEESQAASQSFDSSQPHLLQPQPGLTYRHMAARRRHQRFEARRAKQQLNRDQSDPDVLPSVSSVLGPRAGDSGPPLAEVDDPYAFPASDEQLHRTSGAQLLGPPSPSSLSSSSSLGDPDELLGSIPRRTRALSTEDVDSMSDNTRVQHSKRRRLISRRHQLDVEAGGASDTISGHASANELPTARARRLEKLSRRQIRGVLPFSFMRELDHRRDGEINEEVSRWQQRSHRKKSGRRRALSSSPPPGVLRAAARTDSDGDVPMDGSGSLSAAGLSTTSRARVGSAADLFSDSGSPPLHPRDLPDDRHQPHFAFNFVDIYEWQYPPLAPLELVGTVPDFLKVAARECRRRGVRAKSRPDDASRKTIVIEPRTKDEAADEDVAQSILMAWKMGVIDVRRVYFDETDDSDAYEENRQPGAGISDDDWPDNEHTDFGFAFEERAPILISDDEAMEDNTLDRMPSLHRSGARNRGGSSSSRRRLQPPAARQSRRSAGSNRVSSTRPAASRPSLMRQPANELCSANNVPSTARGLGAVMGEFAAFDSDSDEDASHADISARLPPPLLDQHMSHVQSKRVRQQQFVDRFNRQRKGRSSARSSSSSRSTAVRKYSRSAPRSSHMHVSGGRHVSAAPATAEFLFDDDHRAAIQVLPAKPQRHQTRLLASKPRVNSALGAGSSIADAVADRIAQRRSAGPGTARKLATAPARSKPSYPRAIHRKTVPTRVQVVSRRPPAAPAAHRLAEPRPGDASMEDPSVKQLPFVATSYQHSEIHCLPSGARFTNRAWIAQGGIRQIRQQLQRALGAAGSETAMNAEQHIFQYDNVLRIDDSATPVEFGQAYNMLFMLWHERIAAPTADIEADEDSVLRWISFSQHYIATKAHTPAALAHVAAVLVQYAGDALPRLSGPTLTDDRTIPLAAAVGLSYAVGLLQMAAVLAWKRSAVEPAGPRAVGEEEDALSTIHSITELAAEIDKAVAAVVRLLSTAACDTHHGLGGMAQQIWLVLIHVFSGAEHAEREDSVTLAIPLTGVWSAVQDACVRGSNTDQQRARSLWAALALLLTLAQVNIDGVAAPRPPTHLHRPLLQLAETAADKQLLSSASSIDISALRPSDEVGIRQVYFRVHSIAVTHRLNIPTSSTLFMTLYRFLESIKFCSLSIEPPPSLPRFFTRYAGEIGHQSSASDACTVLWLRALDATLGAWVTQLRAWPPASKAYRRTLRDVRSTVSKMLPTRILTFTPGTPTAQLSTLANYYAVFLLFLHAIPSDVVRAVRLYTQFQTLLRFGDSASQTARRVFFEAWSAAASIIGLRLRTVLDTCGDVCGTAERLVAAHYDAVPANIADYHRALAMAVGGWAEALGAVLASLTADAYAPDAERPRLWALVDAGLMYLRRVLAGGALAQHPLTVALLFLELLRTSPVLDLLVWSDSTVHASALTHVFEILNVWQATLDPPPLPPAAAVDTELAAAEQSTATNQPVESVDAPNMDQDDSQALMDMFDSNEMLEAAAEAEEMEGRLACMAVNTAALQIVHERYVPSVRLHLMSMFTSLSGSTLPPLYSQQAQALETTVCILARMVSTCVDARLRTWESFLDEHGRDSLHLIPGRRGRRLVLVLFAVAAIDSMRSRQQCTEQLHMLAKDVWFASICDLYLAPYTHRLAAQLQWADRQSGAALPVFALMPVDPRLVDSHGVLRQPLGAAPARRDERRAPLSEIFEHHAALAVSCIGSVLQAIAAALRAGGSDYAQTVQKQAFSSWVAQLLSTLHQVRQDCSHATHALADVRELVASMSERVSMLVRDNCAELFLPPHLVLQQNPLDSV